MNKERLLKLADFLDTVPEEKLKMGDWESECGTAYCAFGWACQIPEFQEAGLELSGSNYRPYPKFGRYEGYEASAYFFDILIRDALYLFDPMAYDGEITLGDVTGRIRGLVAS